MLEQWNLSPANIPQTCQAERQVVSRQHADLVFYSIFLWEFPRKWIFVSSTVAVRALMQT
jgi:hypothetical protein